MDDQTNMLVPKKILGAAIAAIEREGISAATSRAIVGKAIQY